MEITVKELEERYKVIEINKISDDVEVVDLWQNKSEPCFHIRLMFAFNKLFTSGDCGCFTFGGTICHIYSFFRGDRINLGYWKEKVEASPRPLLNTDVDTDKLVERLKEYFDENKIEYDVENDILWKIGESNMYRAYDDVMEILNNLDVYDSCEIAGDIIDSCRDWDSQYEYTCNVIQWVENNLDKWRTDNESKKKMKNRFYFTL